MYIQIGFFRKKSLTDFIIYSILYFLIMRTTRRNLVKGKDTFYVVTRDNRRVESINYKTKHEAEERAERLLYMVKEWDPRSEVSIVITSHPEKVY